MVIKNFENHTLFCKSELYKKMNAQVVPKIKNKVRTIGRSDQLIGNKNKQIFHCLDVLIYSSKKALELLLWNSFVTRLFCKEQT